MGKGIPVCRIGGAGGVETAAVCVTAGLSIGRDGGGRLNFLVKAERIDSLDSSGVGLLCTLESENFSEFSLSGSFGDKVNDDPSCIYIAILAAITI